MKIINNVKHKIIDLRFIFFVAIIFFETIFLCYLLVNIFNKTNYVNISPIPKDYMTHPESDLNYYYEFIAKTQITDKQNWLPYTPVYNINSDGLNEISDYSEKKNQSIIRILTLGDSHTFGYLVNTEDNYPEQLERLLNNANCNNNHMFEVINLGIPGYDIHYSVERYKNKGQKYNPDIVLWFLKKDDFMELKEKTGPKISYYRDHPNVEELKDFSQKGYHYYEVYRANKDIEEELGIENILKIQNNYLNLLTEYYKGPLVIFTYDDSDLKIFAKNIQELVSNRTDTYFFPGIPQLYKIEGLHLKEGHPSKEGYQVLVNNLFNFLNNHKIINCINLD